MELLFQPTVSPAAFYQLDKQTGGYENSSAIIISHLFDPEIFAMVERSLAADAPVALVLNRSGYPRRERKAVDPYLFSLTERGATIRLVDSPEDIEESLEGGAATRAR
jgi:hypothetical protein